MSTTITSDLLKAKIVTDDVRHRIYKMRTVILALAITMAPLPALAICRCGCVQGVVVAQCTSQVDNVPICQMLCLPTASAQSVSGPSVKLPGAPTPRPVTDPLLVEEENDQLQSQGITPRGRLLGQ